MKNSRQNFLGRITAKALPMRGILSAKQYFDLQRMPELAPGKIKLFGADFHFTNSHALLHSLREIFVDEVYKFPTHKQKPLIIDAGANIGVSILYLKRLHPNCRIIAFEPDKDIFNTLKANIESFGFSDVEARQSCAWIADTDLQFYSEGGLSGSTEVDFAKNNNTYTVKAERLSTYLASEEVDLLKIDIEGAERDVLFDLIPSLHKVNNLFIEYHSTPEKDQNLDAMLKGISSAGFRYYITGATAAIKHPFCNRPHGTYDLQLNIFAFRA